MRRFLQVSLVSLVLMSSSLLARADCKQCQGRYCTSVQDLAIGWDGCRISSEAVYHTGTNGVWVEIRYKCDPVGENCTNLHVKVAVSDGCRNFDLFNNSGSPCPYWW